MLTIDLSPKAPQCTTSLMLVCFYAVLGTCMRTSSVDSERCSERSWCKDVGFSP